MSVNVFTRARFAIDTFSVRNRVENDAISKCSHGANRTLVIIPFEPRSPKSRVMSQDLLSYTTNIKDVLLLSKNALDG